MCSWMATSMARAASRARGRDRRQLADVGAVAVAPTITRSWARCSMWRTGCGTRGGGAGGASSRDQPQPLGTRIERAARRRTFQMPCGLRRCLAPPSRRGAPTPRPRRVRAPRRDGHKAQRRRISAVCQPGRRPARRLGRAALDGGAGRPAPPLHAVVRASGNTSDGCTPIIAQAARTLLSSSASANRRSRNSVEPSPSRS